MKATPLLPLSPLSCCSPSLILLVDPCRSTMRRVAEVMSKADRRKHDKFSNQFNYAFN